MKKLLFLSLILGAVLSTSVQAQSGPQVQAAAEPANMLQQMKQKQVPGLVEKAGLTTEQAYKVIELNYEMRIQASTELKDLNEADRGKKMAELQAAKEKKFSEFLTPEQITAMKAYYADMRKNMPQKAGN